MKYAKFNKLKALHKSSEVMLTMLEDSPKTATELARESGLRRSTTSQYLNELYSRKLVKKVYYKRQQYFGLNKKKAIRNE